MKSKFEDNTLSSGTVYQLNVKPRLKGERGIPKYKTDTLFVSHTGANRDYNHHRSTKDDNNLNKALLLLPIETIESLRSESWPVEPGDLGENITTSGIRYSEFKVGLKFKAGSVTFQISEENTPCTVLHNLHYVGKDKVNRFVRTMMGRRGWYASVIETGEIQVGDSIHIL
tara:strand:- start:973 stop:1485 length:513 start_codon:yes stop_codon:yes gene_type:complete